LSTGLLPKIAAGIAAAGAYDSGPLRYTLSLSWFPDVKTTDAKYAFGLAAAGAGACYGGAVSISVTLHACGEVKVGASHAVVHDTTELRPLAPGEHLWVAPSLGPRLAVSAGVLSL